VAITRQQNGNPLNSNVIFLARNMAKVEPKSVTFLAVKILRQKLINGANNNLQSF
jgi:hypothetical protein